MAEKLNTQFTFLIPLQNTEIVLILNLATFAARNATKVVRSRGYHP
jgi:hypothetical protein